MMAISIVLVAIGVAIYMDVKLVNMPMEGMTLAISDCFPNIEFHKIKIIVDCSSVAIGVVLSFLFLHGLFGIREGHHFKRNPGRKDPSGHEETHQPGNTETVLLNIKIDIFENNENTMQIHFPRKNRIAWYLRSMISRGAAGRKTGHRISKGIILSGVPFLQEIQ